MGNLDQSRREVSRAGRQSEESILRSLRTKLKLTDSERQTALSEARQLVKRCRELPHRKSLLDLFLSQFQLTTQEGIALLCICEALLRIPDKSTANALIADKIGSADWDQHLGHSDSLFLNASTWALMLTGTVIRLGEDVTQNATGWVKRFVSRLGESAAREAFEQGVHIVGSEFVIGQDIESALKKAKSESLLVSFDMLGEGARTVPDAKAYSRNYQNAIRAIRSKGRTSGAPENIGVSIKLSALHPKFHPLNRERMRGELVPDLVELVRDAAARDIPVTIDAEESHRLELTMDVFTALVRDKETADWNGLGIAVQAYSTRCYPLLGWLQELAEQSNRRLNVRLVKGAYWDTEIKHAQVQGLETYPVFTRKPSTDLSWLVCAERLFDSSHLFPQIATHNAFSIAAAKQISRGRPFEYQRLHGMGELLYAVAAEDDPGFAPVRVYAPVGDYEHLLSYLVRRLLENGANTSFVNRFLDEEISVTETVQDPIKKVEQYSYRPHPAISLPIDLYGEERPNSVGVDYGDFAATDELQTNLNKAEADLNEVPPTPHSHLEKAFKDARNASAHWKQKNTQERGVLVFELAKTLHRERHSLISLLQDEAGKTIVDAVAEVREAIDFCYYYGAQCRTIFSNQKLEGPTGELNELSYSGRGVFLCISPWNFPLAIFLGQITAALAAGNAVVAKPAEQTPRIAALTLDLIQQAGFPPNLVQVVFGSGELGQRLIEHPSVDGVVFTGSVATAKQINRTLAQKDGPIVPLIAETGGVNVMVLDSSILFEQAIDDILDSAFRSAGQRCSALRVLCIQEEIFARFSKTLQDAMDTLQLGSADDFGTDVGPVIDDAAHSRLSSYIDSQRDHILHQQQVPKSLQHTHIAPTLIRIPSVSALREEIFGPILHVVEFKDEEREDLLQEISKSQFALTFGFQTRIDHRAEEAVKTVLSGNSYVNRNMIGATVGIQPFGGHKQSGTGPKAGGPNYLMRFATEHTTTTNLVATGGNSELLNLPE